MRHSYFGKKLGRDTNARKALLNNLAASLLEKGQIVTTLAKAKFARPYVEKLITQSKRANDLRGRRILASNLTNQAFTKLNTTISSGFAKRQGGYTRIIRLNQRSGDAALMARLELLPLEKKAQEQKEPVSSKKVEKLTAKKN
ncbi:MAG TPA: 50S ribosomal protein L17 [Candidatus Saccharimonadales bacterium]|nr:50S ribosomal protein L17 [Candidatus Saccharimonadales bacterium]